MDPDATPWEIQLDTWFITIYVYTISLGLFAAMKHNIRAHKFFMMGSYFGLVGAMIGVVAVPSRLVPQMLMNDTLRLGIVVATIMASGILCLLAIFFLGNDKNKA